MKAYLTQNEVKWHLDHLECYETPGVGALYNKHSVKILTFLMAVSMYDREFEGKILTRGSRFHLCKFGPKESWFALNSKNRTKKS